MYGNVCMEQVRRRGRRSGRSRACRSCSNRCTTFRTTTRSDWRPPGTRATAARFTGCPRSTRRISTGVSARLDPSSRSRPTSVRAVQLPYLTHIYTYARAVFEMPVNHAQSEKPGTARPVYSHSGIVVITSKFFKKGKKSVSYQPWNERA